MIKNVKKYINTCDICQRVKMKHYLSYDELKLLSQLTNSWKEITMNFITDLSSSKWKKDMYDSILMIVDYYMKITITHRAVKKRCNSDSNLSKHIIY